MHLNSPRPPLRTVIEVCQKACAVISQVVREIYNDLGSQSKLSMKKSDSTAFTVADGLVRYYRHIPRNFYSIFYPFFFIRCTTGSGAATATARE